MQVLEMFVLPVLVLLLLLTGRCGLGVNCAVAHSLCSTVALHY